MVGASIDGVTTGVGDAGAAAAGDAGAATAGDAGFCAHVPGTASNKTRRLNDALMIELKSDFQFLKLFAQCSQLLPNFDDAAD